MTFRRGHAYAVVPSAAAGQAPSTDTVELVHVAGGWRIAALGAPQRGPATAQAPYTDD